MTEQPKGKKSKPPDWELESPFDAAATLEELINAPPFKEASDERGESVTSGTRIPTWLHRRVVKLREMPGSPYEVNSDVLRDAVYTGLQILHMRYGMSPDWAAERKMAAVADATGAGKRIRSQVEELISGLEELHAEGDEEQAAQRLSDYVIAAKELESGWLKDRVFRMLKASRVVRDISEGCDEDIQKLLGGKK